MNLKKYYGSEGDYLKEHKEYLSAEQLNKDTAFLEDVLKLKKNDKVLDLGCGNGRHTIELNKKGYDVDGLDFSSHLLSIAKKDAKQEGLNIDFYKQDFNKINLKTKYDKVFLFFPDFRALNLNKLLEGVIGILNKGGLFLLDYDNVFRLVRYLQKNPNSEFEFDFEKMEFNEKGEKGKGVRYYISTELEKLFDDSGLKVLSVYGNYNEEKLDLNSKRIILVGKKIR